MQAIAFGDDEVSDASFLVASSAQFPFPSQRDLYESASQISPK